MEDQQDTFSFLPVRKRNVAESSRGRPKGSKIKREVKLSSRYAHSRPYQMLEEAVIKIIYGQGYIDEEDRPNYSEPILQEAPPEPTKLLH